MTKHYKQFLGKKIAVHMSSHEEWDRVMATEIKETQCYWGKYTSESYIGSSPDYLLKYSYNYV